MLGNHWVFSETIVPKLTNNVLEWASFAFLCIASMVITLFAISRLCLHPKRCFLIIVVSGFIYFQGIGICRCFHTSVKIQNHLLYFDKNCSLQISNSESPDTPPNPDLVISDSRIYHVTNPTFDAFSKISSGVNLVQVHHTVSYGGVKVQEKNIPRHHKLNRLIRYTGFYLPMTISEPPHLFFGPQNIH